MARERSGTRSGSALSYIYFALLLYLFMPLFTLISMSFKEGPFVGYPIQSWTIQPYVSALRDTEFYSAVTYSVFIAVVSTLLAVIFGLWAAVTLNSIRGRLNVVLFGLVNMPLIVPAIVAAVAFRVFMQEIRIGAGTTAIIISHAVHAIPYIALMILTRLGSMPKNLVEAATDLGADRVMAFFRVVIPYLMPAIVGAVMFAFLSSFDDFVRSFFLGAYEQTLPVLIYSRIYDGFSPTLAAIATLILIATVAMGIVSDRILRGGLN